MAFGRPRRRYAVALWLDRRVGPLLCALLLVAKRVAGRRGETPPPGEVRKILLLKLWGMGSIVLASPLLERLRARHPGARIDFASLRENEAVVKLYPEIDRIHAIDLRRGYTRFFIETLSTLRAIRRERYDLLLDLEFFTRFSAIFSFLARARRSHGFSAKGNWRGALHDVQVPFNAYRHVARNFTTLMHGDPMSPLEAGGAPPEGEVLPRLAAPEGSWERCRDKLVRDPAWRDGRPLVVVNPNAGDMALERRWPAERMAELLGRLCAREHLNVVAIGAAAEREYVASVVSASGAEGRIVNLAGLVDLEELVALLARAAAVVTNDSGPLHLAAAAGASTVALFGPETPTLYGPLRSRPGQQHRVHYLGLACSPCMFVHDNKVLSCWFAQARCMTGILPAQVLASVDALIGGSTGRRTGARLRAIDS